MKNITILISLSLSLIIKINAQQVVEQGMSGSTSTIRFYNMAENTYNVLDGSPYSSIDFRDGAILPSPPNTKWISGYKLRYNFYKNQLEFKEFNVIKKSYQMILRRLRLEKLFLNRVSLIWIK